MEITFLIGNGFDIGLGLKSRYTDFYPIYCAEKSNSKSVERFKSMLNDRNNGDRKIINWADFEQSFGEYSKCFDANQKREYLECFEDFVMSFNRYLEKEEKNLDFSDVDYIANRMEIAIADYYKIRSGDQEWLHRYFAKFNSFRNYNFVSFNYTQSVDLCVNTLKDNWINSSNKKIGDIIHIHGYIDRNMIMGVNDPSQISNPDFASDPEIVTEVVKPQQNADIRTTYDSRLTSLISRSDLICIYGMSIGPTDKKWWNMIAKWLVDRKDRAVLILTHDENYNERFPFKQNEVINNLTERFLSYTDLNTENKAEIKKRIFVGINYDVFAMRLKKKKTRKKEYVFRPQALQARYILNSDSLEQTRKIVNSNASMQAQLKELKRGLPIL